MRTRTTEQFNRALALLKNRHKATLSRRTPENEPRVSVDGQTFQRADVIRMAETEGRSDQWKPTPGGEDS